MRKTLSSLLISCSCLLLVACGAVDDDLPIDSTIGAETDEKADGLEVAARMVLPSGVDPEGVIGTEEIRKVFTSQTGFRTFFGAELRGVDFSKQYVIFYSAGTRPSGGYEAQVLRVRLEDGGNVMRVVTRLRTPGEGCIVTRNLTKPYALVSVNKPTPAPVYAKFSRSDVTYSCR